MLKLLENHVKTNILENVDYKSQKTWFFLPKTHFLGIFWHFLVKIFKNIT